MKIISGGQIGADIAGLRAAKKLGFETGGWMTRDWMTKEGPRPEYAEEYGMLECRDGGYPERTRMNVLSSDCTLRFASNWHSYGEQCTLRHIRSYQKPYMDIMLISPIPGEYRWLETMPDMIAVWIEKGNYHTINVSGNANKDIEPVVEDFLLRVFTVQ